MLKRKPRLVVSKCLGFEPCRYSNTICKSKIVDLFKEHLELIPVCPEQAIGLPTPRESLRIVKTQENNRLVQPKTGKDYTKLVMEFSKEFLNEYNQVDGFILKGRSPSCGIKDVKVYNEEGNVEREKTSGIFAEFCKNHQAILPFEDEGRLTNYKIRDLFLTKLYRISEFNDIKRDQSIDRLKEFHNKNTLLFKLYNKSAYKEMERILSKQTDSIFNSYEKQFERLFQKRFRKDSFKKFAKFIFDDLESLRSEERSFLEELIEGYDQGLVTEQTIEYILRSNMLRFQMSDVNEQSFFNRYPKVLYTPSDSGK